MNKHSDSSTESWERIADEWVAHADTNDYRNDFLMPLTLRMLGDVRGRNILDLGCGDGGYARELARGGAAVVGVDGSERLIELARQRALAANLDLKFICANASHMSQTVRKAAKVPSPPPIGLPGPGSLGVGASAALRQAEPVHDASQVPSLRKVN